MKIKITTLNDNTAGMGNFLAEWGLSVLVETAEATVLLDTGLGNSVVHNANTLGIDLGKIDKIVLSHGHGDHTGGLRDVLIQMRKKVEIIAHPDIWQSKYDRRGDHPAKYIGIPFRKEELESLGARFQMDRGPVTITENILTTGEVPMVNEYETIDSSLFIQQGTDFIPDPVMDDRALIIKTPQGLVIILGCAHRGMINTLYHARQITGVEKIDTVIGGSHLIGASEERLWQTIAALKELDIRKLGLCHCTDLPAISVLAQEFRENFVFIKSGTRLEIE
jgi:7,8-dihydropterin-6-yl-methyl-4-(beta-D-ribofuranosyl)aminobenzene 5'-phosphate synthase